MPYALVLVVALTAVGLVLRWWGPINPAVDMTTTIGTAPLSSGAVAADQPAGTEWRLPVVITLTNRSRSSVEVQAIRLRPSPGATLEGLRVTNVEGVPIVVSPGGEAQLTAIVENQRVCGSGADNPGRVIVTASLRTSSGRTKTVSGHRQVAVLCRPTAS